MEPDRAVTDLELFLAERAQPLLRTAILLTGSKEAGEDLLRAAGRSRPVRPGRRDRRHPVAARTQSSGRVSPTWPS
jgi:hypothetical protein